MGFSSDDRAFAALPEAVAHDISEPRSGQTDRSMPILATPTERPLRIAHLMLEFPALSETFILRALTGLIKRGHHVEIFASGPRAEDQVHLDVKRYNLLQRTRYFYPRMPKAQLQLLRLNHLVRHGYKKPAPTLRTLAMFARHMHVYGKDAYTREVLYRAIPFLDKAPYDIIHCHFGPKGMLGVLLRDLGIIQGKIITSFYGYDVSYYLRTRGERVYDELFQKGDLFTTISETMRQKLIALGCPAEKIVVQRTGIETNQLTPRTAAERTDNTIRLISVARLVEKKGVEYGIRAVAQVLQRMPHLHLRYDIIGEGPLRPELEALIAAYGLADRVRLLGAKRMEEYQAAIRNADMLLSPGVTSSDGDMEGISVVLVEALACGVPVLSTHHSGTPELVRDGEFGLLTPERDPGALADAIMTLIEDPERRIGMGMAGRAYVLEHYDIEQINDRLVMLYRRLCAA